MRIARIETLVRPPVAVVRVRTDDGAEGIGQAPPSQAEITAAILHRLVAPHFLGGDPWHLAAMAEACLRTQYKFAGTFLYRALCGVETAVWDLLGTLSGQPVHALLGGALRTEIPVYASRRTRDTDPDDEAARVAALVARDGYRCVKVQIGARRGRDADARPGRTRALIPALRQAVGPDVALSADANGGYSAARAIAVGRLMEAHGYHHFEEPCPHDRIEATAAVADALDIPVSGGEQDNDLQVFKRMIDRRAVDIVQLDIGYVGGLGRARKVADLADLAGLPCMPHAPSRTLTQVFTLHFVAAMPACTEFHEWRADDDDQPWSRGIYEPVPTVVDGVVRVPDGPGWGVALLPDYAKGADLQASTLADR